MFGFRFNVLQMTISLVMSALADSLLAGNWKTALVIIIAGAAGILLLSLAIVFAEKLVRSLQASKKIRRRKRSNRSKNVPAA